MKNDYTHISILLDRSGSMSSVRDDTIGGFNTYLESQKRAPGHATMTLATFADTYHEPMPPLSALWLMQPLTRETYVTAGSTALFDAIVNLIDDTGRRFSSMPESERPSKVIFCIMTDGEENASQRYRDYAGLQAVNSRISVQRDIYKWEFVFMGANQDAFANAARMSIPQASAIRYTGGTVGTRAAMHSFTANTTAFRANLTSNMAFKTEDYADQVKAALVDNVTDDSRSDSSAA